MYRILTVFKYAVLQNLRDTATTLGQMVIFPIVLIFILGMALNPMYEHGQLEPTLVAYLNEDQGAMASQVNDFMARPEIQEIFAIRKVETREQGLELLQNGEITALIHIAPDYSAKVMAGDQAEIQITGHPGRLLGVSMVETVMESFNYGGNAVQAMVHMGNPQPEYAPAVGSIEDHPIAASGLMPNALGYYSVTMLVMITMYGTLYAAGGIGETSLKPVGLRVKATPIRPWEQYLGVTLANVFTVYCGALVIIAFTHFVYGVSWGTNIPMVLLTTFMHVFLAIGLGTMAISLTKDIVKASGLLNALTIISTFLAGGYFKVVLPSSFAWVQYLSPNYLVQTALFNTIYDGPARQTIAMLTAMAGIIIVSFVVSMLAERRTAR